MIKQYHPYHLVNQSPWPLTGAIAGMIMLVGLIELIYINTLYMIFFGLTIMILTSYQWWRDIIREATFQGHHTSYVNSGMRIGMIMFIISEIMFFFTFFWTFFHSSLSPAIEIGMLWPPMNISAFNPLSIPLLNTLILVSSGVTVTWAHHSIINNNLNNAKISLMITILLGVYFSILQGWEYYEAPFSFSDSCFGSTFFMATGFHGLHVMIGSIFLMVALSRLMKYHYNLSNHFGFEAAAWYWHFVDVVWLFLYISIYWWGK